VSGSRDDDLRDQVEALVRWGVHAIEFRLDLIPRDVWQWVFDLRAVPVEWWIAHFGIEEESGEARESTLQALHSEADGCIFHSHCNYVDELKRACLKNGKEFAAPYHSQHPLTLQEAVREFERQASLEPSFTKIAVRANTPADALALLGATGIASAAGGPPAVGAVFGPHRWARVAMPSAGSAITFVVAHRVSNEVGGDDEQLQLSELEALMKVRGILPPTRSRSPLPDWSLSSAAHSVA